MAFTFDSNGNINGDIITCTFNEIKVELVDNFSSSNTRGRNYKGLLNLVEFLRKEQLLEGINRLFIDGSFCTRKESPNDIDLVILCKPFSTAGNIIMENGEEIREHFLMNHLDIYFAYDISLNKDYINSVVNFIHNNDPEMNDQEDARDKVNNFIKSTTLQERYNYWVNFFGYDRNSKRKAILSVEGSDL